MIFKTIGEQGKNLVGEYRVFTYLTELGSFAMKQVGAAIGVAVAWILKAPPLVMFTSAVTGAFGPDIGGEAAVPVSEMLEKQPSITTSELTELFQVSLETIRRDLEYLEEQGTLKLLAGGFYLPQERCFSGHLTLDMIRQLHVSKCFIAPAAISLDFGISDHIQELIMVQRTLLEIADQAFWYASRISSESSESVIHRNFESKPQILRGAQVSNFKLSARIYASVSVMRTKA